MHSLGLFFSDIFYKAYLVKILNLFYYPHEHNTFSKLHFITFSSLQSHINIIKKHFATHSSENKMSLSNDVDR